VADSKVRSDRLLESIRRAARLSRVTRACARARLRFGPIFTLDRTVSCLAALAGAPKNSIGRVAPARVRAGSARFDSFFRWPFGGRGCGFYWRFADIGEGLF